MPTLKKKLTSNISENSFDKTFCEAKSGSLSLPIAFSVNGISKSTPQRYRKSSLENGNKLIKLSVITTQVGLTRPLPGLLF